MRKNHLDVTVPWACSPDLAPLIRREAPALLRDWRWAVRQLSIANRLDAPTLNDHVPDFLEELAGELEGRVSRPMVADVAGSSVMHGLDRLRLGFDIEEVVAEYSALREVLGDLLVRSGHNCASEGYRLIHRFLDKTIGLAVKTYAKQKADEVQLQRQEYLSFVAHELRTPLSSIAMGLALIERSYVGSGETVSLFQAVHRSVGRLKSLVVRVVREENGGQAAERVATRLKPVVQGCLDELAPMALFTGVLVVNAVSDALVCQADPDLLTQILQNLLSNAIRYSPGGEVTVGARVLADETECWVQDNGVGIPADRIERVFAKWETDPDSEAEGMGLGLNIVRQYVEAHGGRVSVESLPGEGATFKFTLRH